MNVNSSFLHTDPVPEGAGEVRDAVESAAVLDLPYGIRGVGEHLLGFAQAAAERAVVGRAVRILFKAADQMGLTDERDLEKELIKTYHMRRLR